MLNLYGTLSLKKIEVLTNLLLSNRLILRLTIRQILKIFGQVLTGILRLIFGISKLTIFGLKFLALFLEFICISSFDCNFWNYQKFWLFQF
jgi:hypothetical protein